MTSNDNIIPFPGWTKLDIDASSMLVEIAKEIPPGANAIVITFGHEDGDVHYHSSRADEKEVYWQLRAFMRFLEEEFMV